MELIDKFHRLFKTSYRDHCRQYTPVKKEDSIYETDVIIDNERVQIRSLDKYLIAYYGDVYLDFADFKNKDWLFKQVKVIMNKNYCRMSFTLFQVENQLSYFPTKSIETNGSIEEAVDYWLTGVDSLQGIFNLKEPFEFKVLKTVECSYIELYYHCIRTAKQHGLKYLEF